MKVTIPEITDRELLKSSGMTDDEIKSFLRCWYCWLWYDIRWFPDMVVCRADYYQYVSWSLWFFGQNYHSLCDLGQQRNWQFIKGTSPQRVRLCRYQGRQAFQFKCVCERAEKMGQIACDIRPEENSRLKRSYTRFFVAVWINKTNPGGTHQYGVTLCRGFSFLNW